MKRITLCLSIAAMVSIAGCGPSVFSSIRMDWVPGSPEEQKQTKEGITIESQVVTELPPDFFQEVQACDGGRLSYTRATKRRGPEPIFVQESILPAGAYLIKLVITNDTDHVIRMGNTAIALFDPADTQYNVLDKDELLRYKQRERPCPSTLNLGIGIQTLKMITRNTELLPKRTTSGYLVFYVAQKNMAGGWKSTIYELPVETDAAGRPTKTVSFDFKSFAKKYKDTYRRENAFAKPVKLSTEEIQ